VMDPKELTVPDLPGISEGDIISMDGLYNRPSVRTLAWWAMLVFGPAFACRHLGFAFRRRISDPMYMIPMRWCGLFEARKLQHFKVKKAGY
jgi:hypothetical protein